jgi:predicted O-methyltransferase YrrM
MHLLNDGVRKSRFHTYKGKAADPDAWMFLPQSLISTIYYKLGRNVRTPWLGYRVQKRLSSLIQPHWKILEFGSGASTVWFARQCALVVSTESDSRWHAEVSKRLHSSGLDNVIYRLRGTEDYCDMHEYDDGYFDLALVDGALNTRDRCAETAIRKVGKGGYILFDNSDVQDPEYRKAEQILLQTPGTKEYFNDFYPNAVQVCESLLIQV